MSREAFSLLDAVVILCLSYILFQITLRWKGIVPSLTTPIIPSPCFSASRLVLPHNWFRIIDPSRFFFCFRAFRTKRKGAELFVGLFTEQQRFLLALVSLAGFHYRLVWQGRLMQNNQNQHMVKHWPIMQLAAFPRSIFQYPRAFRICWQFDLCRPKFLRLLKQTIGPGTKWSYLPILLYKVTTFVFLEKKKNLFVSHLCLPDQRNINLNLSSQGRGIC